MVSLIKLLHSNWTTSSPGTANVVFDVVMPPNDGADTFITCTRPPSETFFTSTQRRTREIPIDIGQSPTRRVEENINVICQINRVGSASVQSLLTTKWNMIEEVRRIVKTFGADGTSTTDVEAYQMGDWQHDHFNTDPKVGVSRGIIKTLYYK